jgi:hypothetical protein
MPRREKKPWERLKDESDPAFRAFNAYLMQPMGGRSMAKAVHDLEMKPSHVTQLEKCNYQNAILAALGDRYC